MFGAFLIDPTFWSRIGFLISFVATSLIAIEVLRLVGTDVNKREVEKFLESYSKQRTASASPARRSRCDDKDAMKKISVNIDELETFGRPVTPPEVLADRHAATTSSTTRHVRAAATPESEQKERRKRATSTSQAVKAERAERTSSPTPLRKLRKRSDTLNSTGSSESRRRHRESSPASEAGSRHGSPRPKSHRKDSGLGLSKLIRAKV